MKPIASQAFAVLWSDGPGWYIITHDGVYNRAFAAASDEDAIIKAGWHIPTY